MQSVYLLLVTVMMSFLLVQSYAELTLTDGRMLTFHSYRIEYHAGGDEVSTYKATVPVIALALITGLLSFFNIFLFHRRILQLRICLLNSVFMISLVIFMLIYYIHAKNSLDLSHHAFRFPAIFPPLAFIMNILAYRNIQRDEMLVNSYNRIR